MTKLPIKILLADDDVDDKMIFIEALEKTTIEVMLDTVSNGIEVIEYLNNRIDQLPDIVFLDLNMPKKDGRQALKEIRSNIKMKNIFVVIYSTPSNILEIEECIEDGADLYICKHSESVALENILQDTIDSVTENSRHHL